MDQHFYDVLDEIDRHNLFRSAAIKHSDTGEIFEGGWHGEAYESAQASHEDRDEHFDYDDWEDGFMTHDGEFLNREEAAAHTHANVERKNSVPAESLTMMTKGLLPLRPDLTDNTDIQRSLRQRLSDHLHETGHEGDWWDPRAGRMVLGGVLEPEPDYNDKNSPDHYFYDHLDEIERFSLYRSAAIRHPKTGEVFEGAIHAFARDNALEAMGSEALHVPWEDGFVTDEGEFHTRRQAARRTRNKAESIALHVSGHLDNEELNDMIEQDPQILEDHGFGRSSED